MEDISNYKEKIKELMEQAIAHNEDMEKVKSKYSKKSSNS